MTVRLNPYIIIKSLICFFVCSNSCFLKSPDRNSNLPCTKLYIPPTTCCIFVHAQAAVSFKGTRDTHRTSLNKKYFQWINGFTMILVGQTKSNWLEIQPFVQKLLEVRVSVLFGSLESFKLSGSYLSWFLKVCLEFLSIQGQGN